MKIAVAAIVLLALAADASGVVFSGPEPEHPDALARWNADASCVAISPSWVILAQHQGQRSYVRWGSTDWPVLEYVRHPSTDLALARVVGTPFREDYVGILDDDSSLKWEEALFGGYGGNVRWGTSIIDKDDGVWLYIDAADGLFFASGDSGGFVGVKRDGAWWLAATIQGISGTHDEGSKMGYAINVRPYRDWIAGIVPEPSSIVLLSAGLVVWRFGRRGRR